MPTKRERKKVRRDGDFAKPMTPANKKLGEKEDLEHKSEFNGTDREWLKLIKTIVAMANKKGGKICYEKVNCDISELDSARVDDKVNSYINPKLHGLISQKKGKGIIITVQNSELKPHIFIRRGEYKNEKGTVVQEFYEGQIWIRHSSKNELLDKSDFDEIVRENLNKILERIKIIAAQYPATEIETSQTAMPLEVKPIKRKRKGVPVLIEKTDPNVEYPYQTKDLAKLLNKSNSYITQLLKVLRMKGDPQYNYDYKNSEGKIILRKYNDRCLDELRKFILKCPNFNPWYHEP
jgi:hypothetical protein